MVWLRDKVFEQPEPSNGSAVCHGMAPDLDEFLEMLRPRYGPDRITRTTIGPVIGTHGGPRVIGVVWQDPPSA